MITQMNPASTPDLLSFGKLLEVDNWEAQNIPQSSFEANERVDQTRFSYLGPLGSF